MCFFESISLPAAVNIGIFAFSYCSSLESVYLLSATSFDVYAMINSSNLADIYLRANNISWGSEVFQSVPSHQVTFHIKAGAELEKAKLQSSYPYDNSFPKTIVEWNP